MLICACTGNKAEQAAEGFLKSYLSMDYDAAVGYCSDNVGSSLRAASDNLQSLDTALVAKIKDAAAGTSYKIVSIDNETEKDKAYVTYQLFPMGSEQGQDMTMTLTKEGGKWLVSALGN